MKCEMKLLIQSQVSAAQPLKFWKGYVISPGNLPRPYDYLSMLELKLIHVCKLGPGKVSFPAEKNPGEHRNALDCLPLHTTVPLSLLTFPNYFLESHCHEQLNTSWWGIIGPVISGFPSQNTNRRIFGIYLLLTLMLLTLMWSHCNVLFLTIIIVTLICTKISRTWTGLDLAISDKLASQDIGANSKSKNLWIIFVLCHYLVPES